MATNLKKNAVKTLGKKSMKAVRGGGGLIIERGGNLATQTTSDSDVMVPDLDARKAGSDQQTF